MKIFVFVLLLIPVTGYTQDASMAHSKCVKYLLKQLNSPGSYKPVSWGKIQKAFVEFSETPKSQEIDSKISNLENENLSLDNKMNSLKIQFKQTKEFNRDSIYQETSNQKAINLQSIDSLKTIFTKLHSHYKPVFDHYYIEHTFRARNAYNALMLNTYVFYLNKAYTVTNMDTESLNSQDEKSNNERKKILDEAEALKKKYPQY